MESRRSAAGARSHRPDQCQDRRDRARQGGRGAADRPGDCPGRGNDRGRNPMKRMAPLLMVLTLAPPLAGQAADSMAAVAVGPATQARQSWTSDRRPLRVGDILTIVVD